jgi:hypothetical protein
MSWINLDAAAAGSRRARETYDLRFHLLAVQMFQEQSIFSLLLCRGQQDCATARA